MLHGKAFHISYIKRSISILSLIILISIFWKEDSVFLPVLTILPVYCQHTTVSCSSSTHHKRVCIVSWTSHKFLFKNKICWYDYLSSIKICGKTIVNKLRSPLNAPIQWCLIYCPPLLTINMHAYCYSLI